MLVNILIGIAGLGCMLGLDLVVGRVGFIKPVLLVVTVAAFIYALIRLAGSEERWFVPGPLRIVAWVFVGVFFAFLIYSHFIELPLRATYAGNVEARVLVTTGTYALSRHPSILWFALFFLFVVVATGSKQLAVASSVWTAANIAVAIIQDRSIFFRVFGEEYSAYTRNVPMLIPNRGSIRRCISTFRLRRDNETSY